MTTPKRARRKATTADESGPAGAPFEIKLASTLATNAQAAGLPRCYLPAGTALQRAAEQWIETHGRGLSDEMRLAWWRCVEALDGAVIECSLGPEAAPLRLLQPDGAVELALREIDEVSTVRAAERAAPAHKAAGAAHAARKRVREERAAERALGRRGPIASPPDRAVSAAPGATRRARAARSRAASGGAGA